MKNLLDDQYITIYTKWHMCLTILQYGYDILDHVKDEDLLKMFEDYPRNFEN